MTDSTPIQVVLTVAFAFAPIVIVLVMVWRGQVERITAAVLLTLWGLLIAAAEHGAFGLTEFGGFDLRGHSGFHFQMLAGYGLVAFALVGVIVVPLLLRADALGWFGLLVVVVLGVGAEVATAIVTTPHGTPPRFLAIGLALWAYPAAWVTALVVSFRPVFRPRAGMDGAGATRA